MHLSHTPTDGRVTENVSDFSGSRGYGQGLMRTPAILLMALAVGLALPGLAAPPHANGNGSGQGAPPQAAEPPSPPRQGPPTGPGGAAAKDGPSPAQLPRGSANSDDAPDKAKKDPKPAGPSTPPAKPSTPPAGDQDEAQQAVQEQAALPLAKIIKIAEGRQVGRVINARLLRVSGVLLYQLTRLDDGGNSWRDYYNAATGNPVVLR